jgi:hypothetical protein
MLLFPVRSVRYGLTLRNIRPISSSCSSSSCSFSSATFRIKPPGLFPSELIWYYGSLWTVGRIHWTADQPCRKATTYAGQHKHRRSAYGYPCLEWDSNPRSRCSSGRRHFMPLDFAVIVISTYCIS